MLSKRLMAFLSVPFIFFAAAHVLGSSPREERIKMNTLHIGMTNIPHRIDPLGVWNYEAFLLVQSVYRSLVRVNETGSIVADLAKRWMVLDGGTRYRFFLDEKAKFHNGKVITSQDVARSFARHLWPDSPSVVKNLLKTILVGGTAVPQGNPPLGIRSPSRHVIEFTLIGPYPPFLQILAMPAYSITSSENDLQGNPVGSGPFIPSYDSSKKRWNLIRSPFLNGSKKMVDSLQVSLIVHMDDALKDVREEKLDLVIGLGEGGIHQSDLPKDIVMTRTQSVAFIHLFFNNDKLLFQDKNLRKDIALATMAFTKENGPPLPIFEFEPSYVPKGIMPRDYYDRTYKPMAPEAIRQRWFGKNGGRNLKLVLRRSHFTDAFGKKLSNVLKDFGFDVQLLFAPTESYLEILRKGDYDIISGGYLGNFPDPDGFLTPINKKSSFQYGNIDSEKFLKALESARHIPNAKERLDRYGRILKEFEEEWFLIPLFRVYVPFFHHTNVTFPDTNFRYECELWKIGWKGRSS